MVTVPSNRHRPTRSAELSAPTKPIARGVLASTPGPRRPSSRVTVARSGDTVRAPGVVSYAILVVRRGPRRSAAIGWLGAIVHEPLAGSSTPARLWIKPLAVVIVSSGWRLTGFPLLMRWPPTAPVHSMSGATYIGLGDDDHVCGRCVGSHRDVIVDVCVATGTPGREGPAGPRRPGAGAGALNEGTTSTTRPASKPR